MKRTILLLLASIAMSVAHAGYVYVYQATSVAVGNGKVYVTDKADVTPTTEQYKDSVTVMGDSGVLSEEVGYYDADIRYFALPDEGYKCIGWYDADGSRVSDGTVNPYTETKRTTTSSQVTMPDWILYARFVPESYTNKFFLAQAVTDGGGKVYVGMNEPSEEDFKENRSTCEYNVWSDGESYDATFYYYAQAAENYEFDGWYDANGMKVSDANPMAADFTSSSLDPDAPAVLSYVAQFVDVSTGINDLAAGEVASVKYVDLQGRVASEPQPGINIEVTTLADGRRVTRKIVK